MSICSRRRLGLPYHIEKIAFYKTPKLDVEKIRAIVPFEEKQENSGLQVQIVNDGSLCMDIRGYTTITRIDQ